MEKDLFPPIKAYFEQFGYLCDGEVKEIDLYMERGESKVAVELKQTLDFRALQQAALRQKLVDHVYIGIFKPKNLYSRAFKDKLYLLKRLGIGLLVVSKRSHNVEIILEPIVSELSVFQRRNREQQAALSAELQNRRVRNNIGGVCGTKKITVYREEALLLLDAMMELGGEGSTREIRSLSGIEKTTAILYHNYYGWFEHVKKGTYKVTEKGLEALEEFEQTIRSLNADKSSGGLRSVYDKNNLLKR